MPLHQHKQPNKVVILDHDIVHVPCCNQDTKLLQDVSHDIPVKILHFG